jgi:hypothetical protein
MTGDVVGAIFNAGAMVLRHVVKASQHAPNLRGRHHASCIDHETEDQQNLCEIDKEELLFHVNSSSLNTSSEHEMCQNCYQGKCRKANNVKPGGRAFRYPQVLRFPTNRCHGENNRSKVVH